MGNRLSKLTTRTGDAGETGIAGNRRLAKTHPRIVAIGEVDELNCTLGLLRCQTLPAALDEELASLQQQLFNLGGQLAMPEAELIDAAAVDRLEAVTEQFNQSLPPLQDFIIPGGNPAASHAHLARAVCRRAERSLWATHAEEALPAALPRFLNRLSDLLFVFCRILTREHSTEVLWNAPRRSGQPPSEGEQGEDRQ